MHKPKLAVILSLCSLVLFAIGITSLGSASQAKAGAPLAPAASSAAGPDQTIKGDWSVFLPEDPGKQLVVDHCFSCHDLARVVPLRGSAQFWSDLVWTMVSNGADISRDDADRLIKYFGDHLGPDQPPLSVPVNINTASLETLRTLAPIASQADKIVAVRKNGTTFASVNDLLKIDGITKESVDKIRPFVSVK